MNRRGVLFGSAAAVVAVAVPAIADGIRSNVYEVGVYSEGTLYGLDFNQSTDLAVARLLRDNPGKQVVEDRRYVMMPDHLRYPVDTPERFRHHPMLCREVTLR